MGEGSKPASRGPTPAPRTLTPVSMGGSGVNGITIEKTRQPEKKVSSNPWEALDEAPQRSATLPVPQASAPPRAQSAEPASNSWNPFLAQHPPARPQASLESSFQNLQVSQTGPPQQSFLQQQQQPYMPQQYQAGPFQPQQQTPSNPWQVPQQQAAPMQSYTTDSIYAPQQPSATAPVDHYSNPFLRSSRSQTFTPSNPWASQGQQAVQTPPASNPWAAPQQPQSPATQIQQTSNPFGAPQQNPWQQQSFMQQGPTASPAPMQAQQEYFAVQGQPQTQPQQQQQQQMPFQQPQPFSPAPANPWQSPVQPQQQAGAQYQQPQPPQFQQPAPTVQPQFPPQPTRHDKSSILALYNMPQLAPQRPLQTLHEDPAAQMEQQQQAPQRSATMPLAGSMNPVGATAGPPPAGPPTGARHVSNESVDFQGLGGRQSPDAFAGLSARYMR